MLCAVQELLHLLAYVLAFHLQLFRYFLNLDVLLKLGNSVLVIRFDDAHLENTLLRLEVADQVLELVQSFFLGVD